MEITKTYYDVFYKALIDRQYQLEKDLIDTKETIKYLRSEYDATRENKK